MLLDPKSFSEENLKQLFALLSKRFPEPTELVVNVYTDLEDIMTPEEGDVIWDNCTLDLAKLTPKYPWAGPEIVKEFEVYYDDKKSVPVLAKMLESDDGSARNWAVFSLARFNRPKFVELLEALVKSGNEQQREFASAMLAQIKAN